MLDSRYSNWRSEFQRLEGAYAPSTMKAYITDVEIFDAWCARHESVAFPAGVATICAFLEDQAPGRAPSTVRRRVYSIRKAHRLLRLVDPTRDEDVEIALRRVRRARHSRPKQARGMTREYLDRAVEAQPDSIVGHRNRALLSLGYDLLARRAELTALRLEDLTWRSDGWLQVMIRRSKSDPFGQGRVAFTSVGSRKLIDAWLDVRGPHIPWLFCPIYHGKPIARPLATSTVRDIIKTALHQAGFDRSLVCEFSGHSLRVGAAQDLLAKGHDTAAIMRAGGWKSIHVLARYLETAEHNVWARD